VSVSRNESDLRSVSCLDDRVRGRLYAFVSGRSEPAGRDEAAYREPGAGRPAKVYTRSGNEFTVSVPQREYQLAARLLVHAVAADRSGRTQAAVQDAAVLGLEPG
jgi:hypothetical protein